MNSWLHISTDHLLANLRAVQAAAGEDVDVLAVIKADAYGHGAEVVAPILAGAGVPWLGVTDVDEALRVRARLGETPTRLLLMVGMQAADAPAIVANRLTPVVWTPEHLIALAHAAEAAGQRCAVHIEVDTGMARQGVAPGAALEALLARLADSPSLVCEGVFTHLCASEVAGSPTTTAQRSRFEHALAQVRAAGIRPRWIHLANSSAVDEASTTAWLRQKADELGARAMVRPGYALYGYTLPVEGPAAQPHLHPHLQPVLTWKTRVLDVRSIAAGDTVGYGATFTAAYPMRLALLPVGYADGFRRAASSGLGNGWVIIAGQRAPVVGRVSMNLTVVDITALPDVRVGTEVTLLGPGVTAEDHAAWAGTIGYDILCGIRAQAVVR